MDMNPESSCVFSELCNFYHKIYENWLFKELAPNIIVLKVRLAGR